MAREAQAACSAASTRWAIRKLGKRWTVLQTAFLTAVMLGATIFAPRIRDVVWPVAATVPVAAVAPHQSTDVRFAAIRQLAGELATDPTAWTKDGWPRAAALSRAAGAEVTWWDIRAACGVTRCRP